MKITCPKCTAQYEVNSSLIPPSGVMMRCPACLHTFPVRPAAAPSLGPTDDEFTPPGAQHRPRPPSPVPTAAQKSPLLPLSAGMVSPIGPVPPSVHDTASDAELPVPKHASVGGRPASPETARRTEAADLPAPKRPGAARPLPEPRPPAAQSQHLILDVELEDLPAPLKPPPGRRPAADSMKRSDPPSDADLLAPLGPSPRQRQPGPPGPDPALRRIPPPAPDPESPSGSTIPELPAPVGPSRRPPARSGKSGVSQSQDQSPWAQSEPDGPAIGLSGEPGSGSSQGSAPGPSRGSSHQGHTSGPLEQPPRLSPVTKLGLADPMPLEDQTAWPELPAPVYAELPSPVHAELPSPVHAELPSPVQAQLPSPVPAELPNPVSGRSRGLDLSSFGSQVMQRQPASVVPTLDTLGTWPPSPGTLRPATSASPGPSLDENSEQLTRPIPPGDPDGAPEIHREASRSIVGSDGLLDVPGLGLGGAASTINDLGSKLSAVPPDLALSLAAGPKAAAPAPVAATLATVQPRRRRRLILAALAVFLVVLVGGGVAGYLLLWKDHRSTEDQARVDQAVRLLGDDMLASYKKAAEVLHLVTGPNPDDYGALALEALSRLGQVRLGVVGEQRNAEDRLGQISGEQRRLPEAIKAKAVLDLLTGKLPEARRALEPLARSAVGRRDALAPVYLGWVELRAGKYDAAQKDFQAALNINSRLPAALYGLAQAKDKAGDRKAANAAYLKVRAVAPEHFGAAVGQLLTSEDADNETKLLELLSKKQRSAGPREMAELWAMLGLHARDQSRWKDAEERLRRSLQADPTQAVAQVALAQISCTKEKFAEAAALAQQAFKADPKNVEAGLVLVRALMSQKKPLDAGAPLAAIVKLAPKDPRVLYWQGRREEDVAAAGGDAKAEALYRKALEADGKYLDAYLALFRVLSKMGKTTDALAALRQAAALAQGDPALATTLGEAYLAAGQAQKAEESFRMALGLKADLHTARMGLATALEQEGQLEAASRELSELEARAKTYPGLTERQARVALLQGKYPQAEALYLKAAEQPGSSQDLRLDAAFYNLKSHTQEADELVEGVLHDTPRSLRGQTIMAALKMEEGQLSESLVHAEMASRLGEQPEVHLVRAQVYLQQNKPVEALSELEKARKAPVEGAALALHARLLAGQNMQADALGELADLLNRQKALFQDRTYYRPEEIKKTVGEAYLLQGDLEAIAQQDDKALRAYELAARTLPESGEAAFKYGKSLYAASKRQPAIKELQRGLQLGGDKPPYLMEATLLLGDALRETHRKPEALRYYKRWLELAPPTAPERGEVQGYVLTLGG